MPGCLAATAQSCELGGNGDGQGSRWQGCSGQDVCWGGVSGQTLWLELPLGTGLGEAAAELVIRAGTKEEVQAPAAARDM